MKSKELWERLAAWGYGAGDPEPEAETAGLELAGRRAEAYAEQFCGFEADIPPEVQDVLLDLAGTYFLRGKLGLAGDKLVEADIGSLKLGDVSVSFVAGSSGGERVGPVGWLESVEQSCRERLAGYRKIKF